MARTQRSRTTAGAVVRVEGLAEFQKVLRAADKTLAKELRVANRDVAEVALRRAQSIATGRQAQRAAREGLTAKGEQRYAVLVLSSAKLPWVFGANFGAGHNKLRSLVGGGQRLGWNQFPQWGGNQFTGGANDQFLYRSLGTKPDILLEEYGEALDRLLKKLGGGLNVPAI